MGPCNEVVFLGGVERRGKERNHRAGAPLHPDDVGPFLERPRLLGFSDRRLEGHAGATRMLAALGTVHGR